jgi:hypothetical protein
VKKNLQFIKLFIVLLFSTAFIFSFSHFGVQAYETLKSADGTYSPGTMAGSVDLSGKSRSEALSLLEGKYTDWVGNAKFELQYSEKTVALDSNLFSLDPNTTIGSIKDGQQNSVIMELEQAQVEEQLSSQFPEVGTKDFDVNKLTANLKLTAEKFENGLFTFNLAKDYLLADAQKSTLISEATLSLKDIPDELQSLIEKNPEMKIAEEGTFSLLDFTKKQKITSSSALSIVATGIYQAILPTNFLIVERNVSSTLPEYAPLGFEARVNPADNADLVFSNSNKTDYTLAFQLENNIFKVSLLGVKLLNNYKISKKDEQELQYKTIVQYSPLLKTGKTMVNSEGINGKFVAVYRDIHQGEQLVKSELISKDYYPPVYKVEIHALTGSQQADAAAGSVQGNSGITPAAEANPDGSQLNATPVTPQQENAADDLWGKPNEQPK